jgi:thioredoxin reductase
MTFPELRRASTMSSGPESFDVLVVGGGPAGLSAALVLGRCRRRVLVCDTGQQRNRMSRGVHGLLTRDGTPPHVLLELSRQDLAAYPDVTLRSVDVVQVSPLGRGFQAHLAGGVPIIARRILLASGVADQLPDVPGIAEFYGTSVHHCPLCDGWEHRDQRLGVVGGNAAAVKLAAMLTHWSRDTVLCTNGDSFAADDTGLLARTGVVVHRERIAGLDGHDGQLERVRFADGSSIARDALFFHSHQVQRSQLFAQLGCSLDDKGGIEATPVSARSSVPGVHVAGDVSRDVQLVAVAIAEGAEAACALNASLLREDGILPA